MSVSASQTIYRTSDFSIRFVEASGSPSCVVSFSSFTDEPSLERPGFGESFLRDRGIDAIHVVNRTNVWYSYSEFSEALARVKDVTARYPRVLTYGSSMGGYAAIRYAAAAGARIAVAISPQYSVSPKYAPFEKRWAHLVRNIDLRSDNAHGSQDVAAIVFYDPYDLDNEHFRLIAQSYPRATGVRLPHAGHPCGAFLLETNLLAGAIMDIVEDRFDAAALEASARKLRKHSGQYLFTLARRLRPIHNVVKRRLADAAIEASQDAIYYIYRAKLLEAVGDFHSAEADLAAARAILQLHPFPMQAYASFLIRRGRHSEARNFAAQLLAIDAGHSAYRDIAAAALLAGRDYAGAADATLQGLAHDAKSPLSGGMRRVISARLSRLPPPILAAILQGACPLLEAGLRRRISLQTELDLLEEWRMRGKRSYWRDILSRFAKARSFFGRPA